MLFRRKSNKQGIFKKNTAFKTKDKRKYFKSGILIMALNKMNLQRPDAKWWDITFAKLCLNAFWVPKLYPQCTVDRIPFRKKSTFNTNGINISPKSTHASAKPGEGKNQTKLRKFKNKKQEAKVTPAQMQWVWLQRELGGHVLKIHAFVAYIPLVNYENRLLFTTS